jgi:hypothetical protein
VGKGGARLCPGQNDGAAFAHFPLEALPDANLIPAFLGELLVAVIFSVASPKWEMTSLPANLRCQA